MQTHVVQCTSLTSPTNGSISCNSAESDVSRYEDQCSFSCDPGYELTGSSSRQCLPNRSWSGEPVTCSILKCNNPEVEIANSQSVGNCDLTYGSKCLLNCSSGFSASGTNEYVCDDANDERISVKWRSIGSDLTCVNDTNSTSKSVIFTEILHYLFLHMCHSAGDNNEDGKASKSNVGSIIGGVLGGVILLLLLIIIALCVVLCSIKWLHDKRKAAKFNSDINMTNNPSYDTNKQNIKQKYLTYDYAAPNEFIHLQQDIIKLDINPSYAKIQNHEAIFNDSNNVTEPDHDVPIELNPSYSSKLRKTSEDHDKYVEIDLDHSHSAEGAGYLELTGPTTKEKNQVAAVDTGNVTYDPNPSYELMTGGIKLQDNPSYNEIKFT